MLKKGINDFKHSLLFYEYFDAVMKLSLHEGDISTLLPIVFLETYMFKPKSVVELGVREGISTFALVRAAALCDATVTSIDIDDCAHVCNMNNWIFMHGDDIEVAKAIDGNIDILFIDSLHTTQHVLDILKTYYPLLNNQAKIMIHDTSSINPQNKNKTVGNLVRSGIEQFLGISLKKDKDAYRVSPMAGLVITHYSDCNGLTILDIDKNTCRI